MYIYIYKIIYTVTSLPPFCMLFLFFCFFLLFSLSLCTQHTYVSQKWNTSSPPRTQSMQQLHHRNPGLFWGCWCLCRSWCNWWLWCESNSCPAANVFLCWGLISSTKKAILKIRLYVMICSGTYMYSACTHIYPPTPADARGSAPGNNTFDCSFGLLPQPAQQQQQQEK